MQDELPACLIVIDLASNVLNRLFSASYRPAWSKHVTDLGRIMAIFRTNKANRYPSSQALACQEIHMSWVV
jgi:hypothetical protein